MPILSAAPSKGDVPARAKTARKATPEAKTTTKLAKSRDPHTDPDVVIVPRQPDPTPAPSKRKRKRRKFDDAGAPQEVTFRFGVVREDKDDGPWDEWRSEVRIVTVEEWDAMEDQQAWGSQSLEDGRIMLGRLIPPEPRKVYHRDDHFPPAAKALRGFRARLLDWLEALPGIGDDPDVELHGEGACKITFGAPDGEGGREAVDLVLSRNEEIGAWY